MAERGRGGPGLGHSGLDTGDRSLDHDESPLAALEWDLTHQYVSYDWQYIRRFESVVRRSL